MWQYEHTQRELNSVHMSGGQFLRLGAGVPCDADLIHLGKFFFRDEINPEFFPSGQFNELCIELSQNVQLSTSFAQPVKNRVN